MQELGLAPSGAFGVAGIFTAAALVFFAFIGFDIVATAAEETKNPQRDMPRGILGSLAICTTLYVAVSLVVTGMVKFDEVSVDAPLAEAFRSVDQPAIATIISVGALAGLTTVMMILMIGQSRVFFAMSRDRLLPPVFAQVNERTGTPVRTTITTGVVIALMALLLPLEELANLVNIGTLFAFIVVAIGVVILRRTRPDLERSFRTPWVPVVPILSVLASFYLMLNLTAETWVRFGIWMVVGLVVYAAYGYRRSRLRTEGPDVDLRDRSDQPVGSRHPVISLVTLVVADYDEAIAFYVEQVGFRLVEDSDQGDGKRWVVVAPPGDGAGLLLARADGPAQVARVGDQTGGRVALFLTTDRLRR